MAHLSSLLLLLLLVCLVNCGDGLSSAAQESILVECCDAWSCESNSAFSSSPWTAGTDYCAWLGITCDGTNVEKISLVDKGLSGTIPESLGELTMLKHLVLRENHLGGSLIDNIGNLTSIVELDVSKNSMHGSLPSSLGQLSLCSHLDLYENGFTGALPSSFTQMTSLQHVFINDNEFESLLPETIGQMNQMTLFDIRNNSFHGSVPASFNNLSKLEYVWIYNNKLSGSLPPYLGGMTSLVYFDALGNKMTGSIPSFGDCPRLSYLYLYKNSMSGSIPTSLTNCTNMEVLFLSMNKFTGSLPFELTRMSKLRQLELKRNSFSGRFPEWINQFNHTLEKLTLMKNSLSGTIPVALTTLSKLEYIWLMSNSLTGTIPEEIGLLTSIEFLCFSDNSLTGSVPSTFGNLLRLKDLRLHDNSFTSVIPNSITGLSNLNNLLLFRSSFHGTIPQYMSRLSKLELLQLNGNHLTSTLPHGLGTLVGLTYLDVQNNLLTGSIHDDLCFIQGIVSIALNGNQMMGTIPAAFSNFTRLSTLQLDNNQFSGEFPWHAMNPSLQQLLISHNHFTGRIETPFAQSMDQLDVLDISFNVFTGNLPVTMITLQLPSVRIFVAAFNCFSGHIGDDICSATSLQSLIIPGLTSADRCRYLVWDTASPFAETFTVQNMEGAFPQCLLQMPSLESLNVGGNGLLGELPTSISSSLKAIDLSSNRLGGTIPVEMIHDRVVEIHLQSNNFGGSMDAFNRLNTTSQVNVSTSLNRLSGKLPASLLALPVGSIDVLKGNVFSCKTSIPANDPSSNDYSCGSSSYTLSLALFLSVMVGFALFIAVGYYYYNSEFEHVYERLLRWNKDANEIYRHQQVLQWIEQEKETSPDTENMFISTQLRDWMSKQVSFQMEKQRALEHIEWFFLRIQQFREETCLQGGIIVVVMIIVLPILWSTSEVKLETSYMWVTTAAYIGGESTVIVFTFALMIFLSVYYAKSMRLRYYTAGSDKEQKDETDKSDDIAITQYSLTVHLLAIIRLFLILGANCVLVFTLNIIYSYVLEEYNESIQMLFTIFLSGFKIAWSSSGIKYILIRNRVIQFSLAKGEYDLYINRVFGNLTSFLVFLCILNNIIIPMLSFIIFSSSCYYNTFVNLQGTFEYSYSNCDFFATDGTCAKVKEKVVENTFDKPFIYLFQCSSTITRAYTTVFIYKFAGEFVLSIICMVVVLYYSERIEKNNCRNKEEEVSEMNQHWINFCHYLYRKNVLILYSDNVNLKNLKHAKGMIGQYDRFPTVIWTEYYHGRLVGQFAIILAFGAVAPLVALTGVLSLSMRTFESQILLGRLLHSLLLRDESKDARNRNNNDSFSSSISNDGDFEEKKRDLSSISSDANNSISSRKSRESDIEEKRKEWRKLRTELVLNLGAETKETHSLFWHNRHIVCGVSLLWWSGVLMDMYGQLAGWKKAWIPVLIMVVWVIALECACYLIRHGYISLKQIGLSLGVSGTRKDRDEGKNVEAKNGDSGDSDEAIFSNPMHALQEGGELEMAVIAGNDKGEVNEIEREGASEVSIEYEYSRKL